MHNNNFKELMKNKIVKTHALKNAYNGIDADITVNQFNRFTRKWHYFTYEEVNEILKKGWF